MIWGLQRGPVPLSLGAFQGLLQQVTHILSVVQNLLAFGEMTLDHPALVVGECHETLDCTCKHHVDSVAFFKG